MLTGPVTMLKWSFERDDQPREATARQLALAIRDEMADLEGGQDRRHPGRRAGPARGPAPSPRPPATPTWPGRWRRFPAGHRRGPRRDPGPHPHVLLGVRRDPARDRRARRRRDLDRGRPLAHGAGPRPATRPRRVADRPRSLRHPLAAVPPPTRWPRCWRRPRRRSAPRRARLWVNPTAASRPATTRVRQRPAQHGRGGQDVREGLG